MYVSHLFFLIHHVHCFDVIGDWDASILYQWPNNIDHRTLINLVFFCFVWGKGKFLIFNFGHYDHKESLAHLTCRRSCNHVGIIIFFCYFLQIKPTSQMLQTNRFQLPKRKLIRELKRGKWESNNKNIIDNGTTVI